MLIYIQLNDGESVQLANPGGDAIGKLQESLAKPYGTIDIVDDITGFRWLIPIHSVSFARAEI